MSEMCSETVQQGWGAHWDGCRRNKTCHMLMIVEGSNGTWVFMVLFFFLCVLFITVETENAVLQI